MEATVDVHKTDAKMFADAPRPVTVAQAAYSTKSFHDTFAGFHITGVHFGA